MPITPLERYLREMVQQQFYVTPEYLRYRCPDDPIYVKPPGSMSLRPYEYPTMTSTKQESKPMANYDQAEAEQFIDKGRLAQNPTITATSNGGFIVASSSNGYDKQAFTNADDLMAYLKIEAKKFTEGHEAQIAARKAAAKKAA